MKILIYRLGSLGDTLLVLPCFHTIRRCFPEAHITLLTNVPVSGAAPPMMDILQNTGTVDEVIEYPVGTRSVGKVLDLLSRLRQRRFDLGFYLAAARGLACSIRDYAFFQLAGVHRMVGVPFLQKDRKLIRQESGLWEWEAARLARRLAPVASINLSEDSLWDLCLSAEEEQSAQQFLQGAGLEGIPFLVASMGTKTEVNDWTEPHWHGLISCLARKLPQGGLVMLGAPGDAERAERCLAAWSGKRLNLCGRVSPRVSAVVLKKALLFLGHDSGPMHLAATVGTPCVGIFAARNFPGQWFPRGGSRNRVLYHQTACFGCGLEVCTEYKKQCILSITVEEVEKAVEEILQQQLQETLGKGH